MDLTKRDKGNLLTGKDYIANAKEARKMMDMMHMPEMNSAIFHCLTMKELDFIKDMWQKMKDYGIGASVTGHQVFWLRDIKDKLVERGII